MDQSIDVVSLAEANEMMNVDTSMSNVEKKQLNAIINHVNDQTKNLSNTMRKDITLQ